MAMGEPVDHSHDYPPRASTAKHPRCPACLLGGYTQRPRWDDGRPAFRCGRCGHEWSCGKTGRDYFIKESR